jgi:hypothetical protein
MYPFAIAPHQVFCTVWPILLRFMFQGYLRVLVKDGRSG